MKVQTRLSIVAGVICSALVMAGVAWAASKTTITMQGPDQVFGKIFSPNTKCLGGRTVKVFKEKGSVPNPSGDTFINKTKSQRQQNHGTWDMGTLGLRHGRFYALATRTTTCKRAISNVITAH